MYLLSAVPDTMWFCALGLFTHLIMTLSEMSAARGVYVTPITYTKERPYKLTLAIVGSIVGYTLLLQLGELTTLTAFGAGYMANDSIDRVGRITAAKMK